jgi:hypothetical protein
VPESDSCTDEQDAFYCSPDCEQCNQYAEAMPPGPPGTCQKCEFDEHGMSGLPPIDEEPSSDLLARALPTPFDNDLAYEDLAGANITRRKLPGITDYNDREAGYWFMIQELNLARGAGNWVPHGRGGASSAVSRVFRDKRVKLGVVNLYGCTSVMVISNKGIWASHFWEIPSFRLMLPGQPPRVGPHDPVRFKEDVIDTFDNGCAFDGSRGEGIACHVRNSFSMFDDQFKPQIVVITPRLKMSEAKPGILHYGDEVQQIVNKVQSLIPNSPPPLIVDYVSIEEDDLVEDAGNPRNFRFTEGKALFQYDPEEYVVTMEDGCRKQFSAMALWVEDRREPVFKRTFKSLKCQQTKNTNRLKRNEGEACPLAGTCDESDLGHETDSISSTAALTRSRSLPTKRPTSRTPMTTEPPEETSTTPPPTATSTTATTPETTSHTTTADKPTSSGSSRMATPAIDADDTKTWSWMLCRIEILQRSSHYEPHRINATLRVFNPRKPWISAESQTPTFETGLDLAWDEKYTLWGYMSKVQYIKKGYEALVISFPKDEAAENGIIPLTADGTIWRNRVIHFDVPYNLPYEWDSDHTVKTDSAFCDNKPWLDDPDGKSEVSMLPVCPTTKARANWLNFQFC